MQRAVKRILPFSATFRPPGVTISACMRHGRAFHTSESLKGYQLEKNLKDCYMLLNVPQDCEEKDVRDAFIKRAKRYHPDGGYPTADAAKFHQVEVAYKTIMKDRREKEKAPKFKQGEEEEMPIFDIKHTAPQHRQYLSFDGIGSGTPHQREKQYHTYRVHKANERVHEYRTEKLAAKYEDALISKTRKATKKRTIRNAMDRLVEDLIQESMARGDFDNLPGKGKPLKYTNHNPLVDTTTHNLNKILIDNGFTPEWIELQREIRQQLARSRETAERERRRLGDPPYTKQLLSRWKKQQGEFEGNIKDINSKINKFNMIVPILHLQMSHYNVNRELKKIKDAYRDSPQIDSSEEEVENIVLVSRTDDEVTWGDLLRRLKAWLQGSAEAYSARSQSNP